MLDSASDDVNKQRKTRVAINAIAAWFKIFHRSKEPNKFCRYEVMITASLHKAKDLKYMKTWHVNSNYRSVILIANQKFVWTFWNIFMILMLRLVIKRKTSQFSNKWVILYKDTMAAAVENDIEEFIRNQKAKLQQERQYLSVRFCMMLYIYSS